MKWKLKRWRKDPWRQAHQVRSGNPSEVDLTMENPYWKWTFSVATRLWTIAKLWRTTVGAGVRLWAFELSSYLSWNNYHLNLHAECMWDVSCLGYQMSMWEIGISINMKRQDNKEQCSHDSTIKGWLGQVFVKLTPTMKCGAEGTNDLRSWESGLFRGGKPTLYGQFSCELSVLLIL